MCPCRKPRGTLQYLRGYPTSCVHGVERLPCCLGSLVIDLHCVLGLEVRREEKNNHSEILKRAGSHSASHAPLVVCFQCVLGVGGLEDGLQVCRLLSTIPTSVVTHLHWVTSLVY